MKYECLHCFYITNDIDLFIRHKKCHNKRGGDSISLVTRTMLYVFKNDRQEDNKSWSAYNW